MGRRRMKIVAILAFLCAPAAWAAPGFSLEPSLEIREVQDDNLNFSDEEPLSDQIRRITPELAMRYESQRLSVRTSYGFDQERFAEHSSLDNARARERAGIRIDFRKSSRLQLSLDGGFVNTDTASELNLDTGLASLRMRGRRVGFGPSARFRLGPRLTAVASVSAVSTSVENGDGSRALTQILSLEQEMTQRDILSLDYEHSDVSFEGETPLSLESHVLLGRWSHNFSAGTSLMLRAGPRFTNGLVSGDLAASLTHNWKSASAELSLFRTQTTVIGYAGAVETESVQLKLSYAPTHRLTAYATPALMRSVREQFEGTVHRVGLGCRYAITSLVDLDIAYSIDRQNGAIDPSRADSDFSRSTLSAGVATRWSSARRQAGRR
jgi:hypothetical protein